MPGPLPTKRARRSNAPTIPTTRLPASGRKGRPPNVPHGYALGTAGVNWWRWAWSRPQAAAWDVGSHYALARRAQLEDDLAAVGKFDLDITDLVERLALEDDETAAAALERLLRLVGELKTLAGGKLAIEREMRELDKRFGLDPKALAELRWTIVPDEKPAAKSKPAPTSPPPSGPPGDAPLLRAV